MTRAFRRVDLSLRNAGQRTSLVLSLAACVRATTVAPEPSPSPSLTRESLALPDAEARLTARELMVPVDGVEPENVPDTFGASRAERLHGALDIMAPRGTPVLSADFGTVWKVRSNALGGRTVYVLDQTKEFVHYFAHLDRYAPGLAEGQVVRPGDVLGYVGTSGNASPNEPHLHYQVLRYRGNGRWWDGEPVNPHRALRRAGRALP